MINKQRILDTFFEYVKIDSETLNEKSMAERLINDLSRIGIKAYCDNCGNKFGSNGGNVYCYLDGDKNYEPIMLSAHIDTVTPGIGIEPFIDNDGYIRSKGNTILGGDDKSGVVAIIEALRVIKEKDLKNRPIEIIFSIAEEGGLRGSKNFDLSNIKSKKAYILDSSGDVGHIIIAAPGQAKITAEIIGRKSHAGIAPENGISSIQVMADAISHMKLLRIDDETTANIGTVIAEGPTNIVCDRAKMIAEARSRDLNKLNAQTVNMAECLKNACKKYNAELNIKTEYMYEPYSIDEDNEMIKFVSKKMTDIDIIPSLHTSGGGSDANVYNKKGMSAIVLGTGMSKVHTVDEELSVTQLENISKLALEMMLV